MDKQQAVQEIIKLKKQYDPSADKDVMMQNRAITDQLRKQYGIDEKMYGSNVSLADAYSNYHKEYGMQQTQPQQQIQPQQQTQQPSFNMEGQRIAYENMMQQSTDGFLQSQISQIEGSAANQIAELEKAYQLAIEEGKLSVREAEKQFEMQKQQIEKQAYIDSERTNAHSQQRGIQNSQQMIGLMQGDNARKNSMLNSNASDRDFRINNIRDRINALTHQKDIDMVNINKQKDYGILAAQGQANQMYTEQMADFLGKDYFTQMGMQHDVSMQNSQFDQRTKEMALQNGYDLNKMSISQMYQQANMKYQNILDMDKMKFGHGLDLEKIGIEFKNRLTEMATQFGYNTKLEGQRHNNAIVQAEYRFSREAQAAQDAYKESMRRQAKSLGLSPNATEKQISDALRAQGREDLEWQAQFELEKAIKNSASMAAAEFEVNSILYNPDLELNPKYYEDFNEVTPYFDPMLNFLNNKIWNIDGKNAKADEKAARKKAAEDALQRWLSQNGVGIGTSYGDADMERINRKFRSLLE